MLSASGLVHCPAGYSPRRPGWGPHHLHVFQKLRTTDMGGMRVFSVTHERNCQVVRAWKHVGIGRSRLSSHCWPRLPCAYRAHLDPWPSYWALAIRCRHRLTAEEPIERTERNHGSVRPLEVWQGFGDFLLVFFCRFSTAVLMKRPALAKHGTGLQRVQIIAA